jgi:hypothetical protein
MEQGVLIKYLQEDGYRSTQIHSKLIEHHGDKALSYSDGSDWVRQFRMGRDNVEDSRRNGKPPDF